MSTKEKAPDTAIKIDVGTYDWLRSIEVLSHLDDAMVAPTPNATAMRILDPVTNLEIAAGVTHKQLLLKLAEWNNSPQGGGALVLQDLKLISDSTTEAAKLSNWTRLMNVLAAFPGISLTRGVVDEIMRGNTKAASDLLTQIYSVSKFKGKVVNAPKMTASVYRTGRDVSSNNLGREEASEGVRSSTHDPQMSETTLLRIGQMTENSDLSQCESLLEFFCVCAAKETSVKPIQILSLFKDNQKNWAALLTKGKNGDHKPIVRMLGTLLDNFPTYSRLLVAEFASRGISFALDCLKPGLQAKDLRVALYTCKAVTKTVELVDEEQGPADELWDSFTKVYGVFLALFSAFDTFGDLILREMFAVCRAIGKFDLLKMFKDEFRKLLPDPKSYAMFLNHILTYYLLDDQLVEDLTNSGVIDHLMRYALSSLEKPNSRDLQSFYQALIELVCRFIHATPVYFTNKPQLAASLLNQMKMSVIESLSTGMSTLVCAITQVSDLLPILSSSRSNLSPAVFKLLCQLYILATKHASSRGFAHQSMRFCLESIPTLPSDVIMGLALEWADASVKGPAYDSECCPSFFDLLAACLVHPTAQVAKFDVAIDSISQLASRFKFLATDWARLLGDIVRRFGREIINGANRAVINLCCQIYVGLVQKQRDIDTFLVQPGGVPTVSPALGSYICLHHLVKDYQGAQWGNKHTLLAILHTSAKVQMLTQGEINKGLYLIVDSGWGKPEARFKSYSPAQISSSVSSLKDLHAELSSLGEPVESSPKNVLEEIPQSESQIISTGPTKKSDKRTALQKKPKDNKKLISRASSANKKAGNPLLLPDQGDDEDMFASAGYTSSPNLPAADLHKSSAELPGYMKGLVLDPEIIRMRRFDEVLRQKEQQQRASRDKREKQRLLRLQEIKQTLQHEREELMAQHAQGGDRADAPVPRANGRLIRSAQMSKGETARKMQQITVDVKKEEKRKKRHMEVKALVENRRQEILEAQAKNEKELEHQEKVKEFMKAKLAESKAFIKAQKEKLKKKGEEAVFLSLLKEVFEKNREEALKALPGRRMEKMRSKIDKRIEKRTKENALKESLMKLLHSEGIKMIFKENEPALKVIFDFLCNIDKEPKTIVVAADKRIQCRTFFEFANMQGFVPLLMTAEELKVIYRGVVKGQTIKWNTPLPKSPNRTLGLSSSLGALRSTTSGGVRTKEPTSLEHELPIGLDFNQFKDILFRISLKKKPVFDKTVADTKPDEVKITYPVKTQFEDFSGKDFFGKEELQQLDELEETYNPKDMAEYHYQTLEGLFNHMKLPYDPENVKKKMVFMRADYLKNIRPKDHRTRRRPQANRFMRMVEKGEERREKKVEDTIANMINVLRDQKEVQGKSADAKAMRDQLLKKSKEERELSRVSDGRIQGGATATVVKEVTLVEDKSKPNGSQSDLKTDKDKPKDKESDKDKDKAKSKETEGDKDKDSKKDIEKDKKKNKTDGQDKDGPKDKTDTKDKRKDKPPKD